VRRLQQWWRSRTAAPELVPLVLPEPLRSQVVALLADGAEVAAVRLVRQRTGAGLLVAVNAVRGRRPDG
jgi:hypothetical protein